MPTDLWLLGLLFFSVFGEDSQREGDWPPYRYEDSIYIIIPIIFQLSEKKPTYIKFSTAIKAYIIS
jgi:hypothetical protein